MSRRKKIGSRIIAVILCMAIFVSQVNVAEASDTETSTNIETESSQVSFPEDVAEPSTENGEISSQSVDKSNTEEAVTEEQKDTESQSEVQTENSEDMSKNSSTDYLESYYKDGKICIYSYEQLLQIGTDATIHTGDKDGKIGTGETVKSAGTELKYSLDGQYLLMNDIPMDMNQQWNFPEGFTGAFSSDQERTDNTIYDSTTDTIYVYNRYQMALMYSDSAENEPVMSEDYQAERVGMGQIFTLEDGSHLTYSKSHKYVLASSFTQNTPDLIANKEAMASVNDAYPTDYEGRDYFGQVVKKIGDKDYILIGNEKQLRAIGTGVEVTEPIWRVYETREVHYTSIGTPWGHTDWTPAEDDGDYTTELYYPGDADLVNFGDYAWSDKELYGNDQGDHKIGDNENLDKKLDTEALKRYVYVGSSLTEEKTDTDGNVTQTGGLLTYDTSKTSNKLNITSDTHKYTNDANYIIFRDINLSDENWTPLMFSGTMIGAKSINSEKLWNDDGIVASGKPVISDVKVTQTGELDVGKQMGVGFFATISDESSTDDIGISKGLVKVSNLKFQDITVDNQSTKTKFDQTLVSGLTTSLGLILGSLVDGLAWLLTFGSVDAGLRNTLSSVLNARKNDPSALATGALAGRVIGQVEISDCELSGTVSVQSSNNDTGGLVGYVSGKTQYDGLSKALGGTATVLANILNVIPGLGLGDLITILLGNAIPVDKLIPTAYINAKIINCSISGLSGKLGTEEKDYVGGLIGQQIGTIVDNCNITDSSYTITAQKFAGGFVGLSRDDVIEGTLSGALDIETKLSGMNPESLLYRCSLSGKSVKVTGSSYTGGFVGAMANTSAVDDTITITEQFDIMSSENNAGGFAGIATFGWGANLGKGDTSDNLLGGVVDLVVKLLSSNPGATTSLLSLAGINPSYIMGCQINAPLKINGADYVGGITGRGDGAYITSSSEAYLKKVSYWKNGTYTEKAEERITSLKGIVSVSGKDYVGGIAGSLGTASVAGLLNTTLGVASYLAFTMDNVILTGTESGVKISGSGERIGGAVGEAIGGSISAVAVSNLADVQGNNMVGGFIGLSGPGDLAGTDGGLTVNLLGLNYVLKISNLLSLGQAVEVQVKDATVRGVVKGYTVEATGSRSDNSIIEYAASGFAAHSNSTKFENCHAVSLAAVIAADNGGSAGGFVGISKTGGLAEVGDETSVKTLVEANGLLNAVKYLIPSYTQCTVTYTDGGGVTADTAGGFAGDFQSGTVNNQAAGEGNYYAVYNLDHVTGQSYAGGFGGNVYSGALANAGKGISILGSINGLNINIGDLVNLINAYIPYIQYAGIKSEKGFTVSADTVRSADSNSGSAGGFIGYGSGVQVSYCDVSNLKHTKVTTPSDLESTDGSSYFNEKQSTYAVTGARYAGGYIGYMDIGSAASVGKGLSVLGTAIGINDVLDALNVVVSTVEHSNVTGNTGGFAVKASLTNTDSDATEDDVLGDAGGFAGKISGGHIQNSNSYNFSYIIGQITSGGYVGDLEPGNIASVLGDASILGGLVNVKDTLASVAQDFVPTIRNSSTTCISCGGAVRAEAASTTAVQRGLAGGYAGHNEGGHILGNNTKKWKGKDYTGPTSTCKAVRIRSVYGAEIAGGFTGLMESADTASTGNLSLLWGLVKADNILGALSIVYPTEENTAVYGPLAQMDYQSWNSWVQYVGKYGGYGSDLAENGTVNSQDELDAILGKYAYGYNVVAGRSLYRDETTLANGGAAGGYVGSMQTGTITNGQAYQTKAVKGLRCAGGFAGEMINGGAASLGGVDILGLKLDLGQMLNVLDVFVPVIKQSVVEGYQSGLNVQSNGTDSRETCGYAGGYVGKLVGGQIWGNEQTACQVTNLRRVDGTSYVGGFVGDSKPGSAASVNTTAGEGLLSKLLNSLLETPADFIKVLDATVATIRYADVSSWDDWGIIVNGAYANGSNNTSYAKAAGGFAGSLSGTVVGKKDTEEAGVSVNGIRSVVAGEYAGGCFGIADVDAGVQVSGNNETTLLKKLLQLGRTDVLDAFRTYVYYGNVSGSNDAGLSVHANVAEKYGQNDEATYSGNAGGFGGALLNSSVKNSTVTKLSNVTGQNSTGGFIGYSGKSGVVDLSKVDVLGDSKWQLLGGAVGVLSVFGSHIDDSSVSGIDGGYTVQSSGGEEQIAGGFIGYANLARMSGCTAGDANTQADGLKQVASGGTAGGFSGRTSYAYLADIQLDSTLVNALLNSVLNPLVKALYLDKAQTADLLNINLGILQIQALYEGNLVHVNLLGLDISVALSKASKDNQQQTDFAIITIGDSTIKLPCDKTGIQADDDTKSNISISLIKANRTKITDSKVYGISTGYDVYGGGAGNNADGTAADGRSGGFVGYNDEGLLQDNDMYFCDVVRGTSDLVGPFSGECKLDSVYSFNTKKSVEGEKNNYRIYRKLDKALNEIKKSSNILNSSYEKDDSSGWSIYTVGHMQTVENYDDLKNAELASDSDATTAKLDAYESSAKAVLMADTKTTLNTGESDTPEPSESQDPCDEYINLTVNKIWKDLNNFSEIRPENIKVTISRTWTDADNREQTEIVPGYESYNINGSEKKSTWQEVIKGLPAYETDEDGTIHYYTYSVTETEVDGYTTTITPSDDGFTFDITNRHFPSLPDTGGNGGYMIYLIGILLLLVYLVMRYKKSKENQKAEQL